MFWKHIVQNSPKSRQNCQIDFEDDAYNTRNSVHRNSGEPSTTDFNHSPKKSGSPVFSKFFTRRSVNASSSCSVLVISLEGCGGGGGLTLALVNLVAVIRTGFGETGGGIFLPVAGSNRTGVLEVIVVSKHETTQALQCIVPWDKVNSTSIYSLAYVNELEWQEFGCEEGGVRWKGVTSDVLEHLLSRFRGSWRNTRRENLPVVVLLPDVKLEKTDNSMTLSAILKFPCPSFPFTNSPKQAFF